MIQADLQAWGSAIQPRPWPFYSSHFIETVDFASGLTSLILSTASLAALEAYHFVFVTWIDGFVVNDEFYVLGGFERNLLIWQQLLSRKWRRNPFHHGVNQTALTKVSYAVRQEYQMQPRKPSTLWDVEAKMWNLFSPLGFNTSLLSAHRPMSCTVDHLLVCHGYVGVSLRSTTRFFDGLILTIHPLWLWFFSSHV